MMNSAEFTSKNGKGIKAKTTRTTPKLKATLPIFGFIGTLFLVVNILTFGLSLWVMAPWSTFTPTHYHQLYMSDSISIFNRFCSFAVFSNI